MKKNNSLALVASIIVATILSSCSSEKGLTIEKRKYRNGYSVAWNSGKAETQQKSQVASPSVVQAEPLNEMKPAVALIESESIIAEPILVASSEQNASAVIVAAPETDVINSTVTVNAEQISESKNQSPTVAIKYTRADRKEMRKFLQHKAPGDTDIPLWAYILFAIILPPLAVGLFEGIHGPFWISILLTLLFWIPGVIYALWRVLK